MIRDFICLVTIASLFDQALSFAPEMTTTSKVKFLLIPGNGGAGKDILSANWYGWFAKSIDEDLKRSEKAQVIAENYPDPFVAKNTEWLPHITHLIAGDSANTVLIGHSSGALAAMRMAESTTLRGIILVSPAYTDLGDENERASGYFDTDWDYGKQVENAGLIHIFHSEDDHLIPVDEARYVASNMKKEAGTRGMVNKVEYDEMKDHSHFFEPFDKLLEVVDRRFLGL